MRLVKCRECVLLSKCPSGQRCVELISEFEHICPVGETNKDIAQNYDDILFIEPADPEELNHLGPIERNELEKAMMGRGIDYNTIQLILRDFDARIEHLNSMIINRSEYLESIRPKTPIPPRYI